MHESRRLKEELAWAIGRRFQFVSNVILIKIAIYIYIYTAKES